MAGPSTANQHRLAERQRPVDRPARLAGDIGHDVEIAGTEAGGLVLEPDGQDAVGVARLPFLGAEDKFQQFAGGRAGRPEIDPVPRHVGQTADAAVGAGDDDQRFGMERHDRPKVAERRFAGKLGQRQQGIVPHIGPNDAEIEVPASEPDKVLHRAAGALDEQRAETVGCRSRHQPPDRSRHREVEPGDATGPDHRGAGV